MAKLILRPTSDILIVSSILSTGTDAWALVDEVTSDDDGTYISAMAPYPIAIFGFPAHGLADGTTINSVKIYADAANCSSTVKLFLIAGSSPILLGSSGITPTAYQICSYESTTNPLNGVSAWDIAGLNMILGFGASCPGDISPSKLTQCYMEIDYTAGGGGGGANSSNFFLRFR